MKKASPLFLRLLLCAVIPTFCGLSFPAHGKDTNESPEPWTNSLGMKFVPVPGTEVLFSIWDTRVQDYEPYVAATGRTNGEKNTPPYEQGPTHPVSFIGWKGCKAFCAWLTEKERREGKISSEQFYRLPTDLEWSTAAGLKNEPGNTAAERAGKIKDVYPWGKTWPPPRGAGNYGSKLHVDDFDHTSPVGSFAPNRFGLYDMGGNVNQWCEDIENGMFIMRGGSWKTRRQEEALLSTRWFWPRETFRDPGFGFRCVLAGSVASTPQAQSTTAARTPADKLNTSETSVIPSTPSDTQSALQTLSQHALNAADWALAPLDQSVPGDIRRNLTALREELLDEGKAAPKASADAYKLGSLLCDNLISALDERDQALVGAGYRAAQADANTRVTSQSLEARRNYLMSWPQYSREKDERSEIQRQQTNNTVLVKESLKTAWFNRTKALRKSLDALYAKYREALRN